MIRKKTFAFLAAGTLLAGVVGAGIAYASIPATDGTIHGCYSSDTLGTGDLYVIDDAATCPSGYTALNWNQEGSPGVSGYEVVTDSYTNTSAQSQTSSVEVNCPTGKVALGGGGSGSFFIQKSQPIVSGGSAVGWDVQVHEEGNSSDPITAYGFAICATVGV